MNLRRQNENQIILLGHTKDNRLILFDHREKIFKATHELVYVDVSGNVMLEQRGIGLNAYTINNANQYISQASAAQGLIAPDFLI